MIAPSEGDITELLNQVREGQEGAAERLASRVFDELHRIAVNAMRREDTGHTLQPTELVDEAFLRLIGHRSLTWQNRSHFYALAATTIRRILVDHARARDRIKRDHGLRATFDEAIGEAGPDSLDLIALDDALERLGAASTRQARVVELRFFGGLEVEEVAEVMGVSPATVKRDWNFARAFLLQSLESAS
jgi:RNA polymerase sigma factor (TIGR02999 family)